MGEQPSPILYVGIDWASEKHDVCALAPAGRVLAHHTFEHSGAGLGKMVDWILKKAGGPAKDVYVGIEVPHGPVVETLIERGFVVHSLNPKQLDRFRDRFTMAGAKDDRLDAQVLADSLRTDAHLYRRLQLDPANVIELREWSRVADELQQARNRATNRFLQQLRRFMPQAIELTKDVGEAWFQDLLELIPTPAAAHQTSRKAVEEILRKHRIRRITASEVLKTLRKQAVFVAPGTIEGVTAHMRLLKEQIRLMNRQLKDAHATMEEICDRMGAPPEGEDAGAGEAGEQRDVNILRSLPGVGGIVVATLLAEASQPIRDRDYQALRSLCGVAPVTHRSGKRMVVVMRKACQRRLRHAAYHWGRVAATCDSTWRERYRALRARGHSHGRACRGIADRLLAVAVAMLKSNTTYDENRLRKSAG
jgi:transposase